VFLFCLFRYVAIAKHFTQPCNKVSSLSLPLIFKSFGLRRFLSMAFLLNSFRIAISTRDEVEIGSALELRSTLLLAALEFSQQALNGEVKHSEVANWRYVEGISLLRLKLRAMTANGMKEDREKCLLIGMDDFIGKPVGMETLSMV